MTLKSIFAGIPAFAFTAKQFDDCKDFLANRTANTELVPIVDENQLIMSADGRLRDSGYRFNAIGFSAVTNTLAAGLCVLFNELSGENMRNIALDNPIDIATAVGVYNATLRIRFEALRERSLLVDHSGKAIEGFLGLDHKMLDNSLFLNIVCNELFDKQPEAEFSRAELIGRELRLYFIDPTTRRNDIYDQNHTFAGGWYFANREDTGKAVKAATCLYTRFGVAVEPPTANNRIKHIGPDLAGRTAALAAQAAYQKVDMSLVAKHVRQLAATPLNFSANGNELKAAMDEWVNKLCRHKIFREDAKRIVKNAALVGADLAPRDALEAYTKEVLTQRTAYDLFCSILRYAKNQHQRARDVLQTTAMRLVLPDAKSKKRKQSKENDHG